jgi:glycosyltransferase involved in cell wall biosynthesis
MNVLYLTMNPNRASTTVPTEGWFRLLPERGLRPVLVSRERGAFHEWTLKQGIAAYLNRMPLPDKRGPLPFLGALWSLRRIVKKHRVQLIHCNEQDIYPVGHYLGRLCRIPVVVSVHFTLPPDFAAWAFGGRRQPDRIFFISDGNLEACRPAVEGVIDESRWRMLYNGLDLSRFRPDPGRRAAFRRDHGLADSIAIGVACALRERKQLEHLIEAAEQLGDPRIRVVVAGGPIACEREYAERLLREARGRLGGRLVLLGHLDDLRGFYNGLDVFVNTSREEACSISVLESLASGCPVLGYPSKSVHTQILPDGGEIVEQDDVPGLALALARWIADADRLAARRDGARRQARRFDIEPLAAQLWDEYEQLVGAAAGAPAFRVREPEPA